MISIARWHKTGRHWCCFWRASLQCLALMLFLCSPTVSSAEFTAGDSGFSDSGDSGGTSFEDAEKPPEKKKVVTASFASFTRGFKNICNFLKNDGRMDLMARHIEFTLNQQEECSPCKAFLRSFGAACKVKLLEKGPAKSPTPDADALWQGNQVSAKVETPAPGAEVATPVPAATPIPPQREPSTELLDAVSQVFIQMANDNKRAAYAAQTVRALTELMRDPEDVKPGEHEYLDILAEYMLAPFRSVTVTPVTGDSTADAMTPTPVPRVDDLFEK